MARDRAVHQRLGEGRLVGLVVPVPAIAEQVDDDVLFELLAVFGGGAGDLDDRLGIVAVDVKDRRLDALCHIRRVGARPGGGRAVVKPIWLLTMMWIVPPVQKPIRSDNSSDSATSPWPAKAASPCIRMPATSRPLASSPRCCCFARTLPSTTGSTASRCDGLAASDRWTVLPADLAVARGAEMVFDVARAVDVLGIGRIALELGEDRGKRLADEIGEHVEPAAVRHADHEFADAELAAAAQDRLERRHQRFGAFDAKPLGAGVAPVEKPLEGLGRGQGPQNLFFYCRPTAPGGPVASRIFPGSRPARPAPGCACTRRRSCRNRSRAKLR